MATRRMFSLSVIDTDKFMEMPITTQALYFHLGLRADDDGFVSSPKKIARMIGSNEDDLRVLASKGYIIPFDSGVIVISDWKMNNYLRSDRYKATIHQEEKSKLVEIDGKYHLSTDGIPKVGKRDTQVRVVKDSVVKGSIEKDVCPEPETPPQDLSGILLPLIDKTQYNVPVSKIETWTEAYPAVDIRQELRKMIAWLEANPQRRKTRRGIDRFICIWLSREQDKGGRYKGGAPQEQVSVQQEKPEYYKYLGNTPPGRDDPFR